MIHLLNVTNVCLFVLTLSNLAVFVLVLLLLKRNHPIFNVDHYLLLLNILDRRITDYRRLFSLQKERINKKYQVDNPSISYNKKAYNDELQQYLRQLIKQLLQEFSRDSRKVLISIFSEEGLIRYIADRILE